MAWMANFEDFNVPRCGDGSFQQQGDMVIGISGGIDSQPTYAGCKTSIADLNPVDQSTTRIVGVVIAKEDPRQFPSKKDPSSDRHVLNFTIRDSPTDFINVTCWGDEPFIHSLAGSVHIGDVVELGHPGIQSKPPDGSDERFRPWTPSQYQLSISENRGSLKGYTGWDAADYGPLLQMPVRASNDYYTIADIEGNGQTLHGQFVNLLAAVRSVGTIKNVTTKTGKKLNRLEVKLFDETAPLFVLILWDNENIGVAQGWLPKDHVILAADVRLTYDDFKKSMIATATGKTIITLNPDTQEAHQLYRYAQTVELPADNGSVETDQVIDLSVVHAVYSVAEVQKQLLLVDRGTEYGIVYACVTSLDLDGEISSVVAVKCSSCKFRVDRVTQLCCNPNCAHGALGDFDFEDSNSITTFELRISLSDHTGTLDNCYLSGAVAENMLGCSVDDFLCWDEGKKTSVKWQFLMEQCKVYLKMVLPNGDRMRPIYRVLSLCRADVGEAVKHLD